IICQRLTWFIFSSGYKNAYDSAKWPKAIIVEEPTSKHVLIGPRGFGEAIANLPRRQVGPSLRCSPMSRDTGAARIDLREIARAGRPAPTSRSTWFIAAEANCGASLSYSAPRVVHRPIVIFQPHSTVIIRKTIASTLCAENITPSTSATPPIRGELSG